MAQFETEQVWIDFRIGLITFSAVVFLVFGITFAGGDKGLLLQKVTTVKARLADVGGLKKGASVTMSGMVIGKVTHITFADGQDGEVVLGGEDGNIVQPHENSQIEVAMEIRSDMRRRIKIDSVPAVRTQGMLGDRYIDLPSGSEEAEILPEGKVLIGAETSDFDKTLRQTIDVLNETQELLKAINDGEGTAGKLVYDEKFYENLMAITDQLNELLKDFKKNPRRYIKFSLF
ncbi:MAG: MCE family protein [Candidatus Omnitrophica bacterium]|nr:MCE family protein [Candidatus Omnitrophota bacterium]